MTDLTTNAKGATITAYRQRGTMGDRIEVEREAQAAAAALDYFQSVLGFSGAEAVQMVAEFIVAPSPAVLAIMRQEFSGNPQLEETR